VVARLRETQPLVCIPDWYALAPGTVDDTSGPNLLITVAGVSIDMMDIGQRLQSRPIALFNCKILRASASNS